MERDGIFLFSEGGTMNFNSHAHVERDTFSVIVDSREQISTHTLTWSVTFTKICKTGF